MRCEVTQMEIASHDYIATQCTEASRIDRDNQT